MLVMIYASDIIEYDGIRSGVRSAPFNRRNDIHDIERYPITCQFS